MTTAEMSKTQFYCEALIEQLNTSWKVDAVESGHSSYHSLEMEEGKKYYKIWEHLVSPSASGRSCWMFVEKETGFCYKPASYRGPAKGVRYGIHQLVNYPETCDPYGSFLYMK
jgi:hypothetical protein